MSATITDHPKIIETLLDGGSRWDTSNHTGNIDGVALDTVKPTIKIIYDSKRTHMGSTNNIYIYEISNPRNYDQYAVRNRYDRNPRISIDIRTSRRIDLKAKRKEAMRILENFRTTIGDITMPSGYTNSSDQVWILEIHDRSDNTKDFHREVVDIMLRTIGKAQRNT